jgi:GNAT superfamily N-acetyltransferase
LLPLKFEPLTADRWQDLERLFGQKGGCGGCWCMLWRLTHSQFEKQKGNRNRLAMKRIVQSGRVPGILAYLNGKAVGWCAVAPRSEFVRLETSRVLQKVDDLAVWSVVCLFVAKAFRHQGISTALLNAAAEHVRKHGGTMVEGYPIIPQRATVPDVFAWTGFLSTFQRVGFVEVARRSPNRPIVRCSLDS